MQPRVEHRPPEVPANVAPTVKVTRFLFLATIFCVTFEKVHWNFAGTVSLADLLALGFLVMWALERLALRDRRLARTSVIVIGFALAFLLVYLLGYFAIHTKDGVDQFGKGIFKWAIHILFLIAGVTYLGRRSERFFWRTIGVFTAGLVLNSIYGVLQLAAVLAFFLIVELATLSRSGLLGLGVGLLVLALPYRRRLASRDLLVPL